jgi:antitoxin ParD1/3/4
MKITLDPKLERFVEEKVKSGQYASADAVVTSALSLLRDQETLTAEDVARLKREVAIGIEQLDRGESAPWDPEEIKAKGRKIFEARRRKA